VRRSCLHDAEHAGSLPDPDDASHRPPPTPPAKELLNPHPDDAVQPKPLRTATSDAGTSSHVPSPFHRLWQEVKPLLSFSAQTLCIAVTNPLLSLVDTSVVGLSSEAQLAAMAPATALSDGLAYTLTFIPIGVTNLVSLHMSRGHPRRAGVNPAPAIALWSPLFMLM
jgi:hypothetical protein